MFFHLLLEVTIVNNSVKIPTALQICVDDVGWFIGSDDRYLSRPSRTGLTRRHAPEDYIAVNEIGKAIGQKIMCPLVLGEWDKDNILRGEIGVTFDPKNWDRASLLDLKLAQRCFEAAESSEYIEYAIHGVLHGSYDAEGKQITELECFKCKDKDVDYSGYINNGDGLLIIQTEEEIAHRFDLFFKLYNMWGFKKKIRSYAAPNGLPKNLNSSDMLPLASVLKKNGITYWANSWGKPVGYTEFIDGILYMEKCCNCRIPWNACDVDPDYVQDFVKETDSDTGSVMSTHWPNFLRFNAQNNLQNVDKWAAFFKRQSEIFGLMISKDIAFAGSQCVYHSYSKIDCSDKKIKIDISDCIEKGKDYLSGELYVSLKNDVVPASVSGGTIELYETHKDFKTYKIAHTSDVIEITVE